MRPGTLSCRRPAASGEVTLEGARIQMGRDVSCGAGPRASAKPALEAAQMGRDVSCGAGPRTSAEPALEAVASVRADFALSRIARVLSGLDRGLRTSRSKSALPSARLRIFAHRAAPSRSRSGSTADVPAHGLVSSWHCGGVCCTSHTAGRTPQTVRARRDKRALLASCGAVSDWRSSRHSQSAATRRHESVPANGVSPFGSARLRHAGSHLGRGPRKLLSAGDWPALRQTCKRLTRPEATLGCRPRATRRGPTCVSVKPGRKEREVRGPAPEALEASSGAPGRGTGRIGAAR